MQVGQLVAWGERAFWVIAVSVVHHISWVVKVYVQLVLPHHPERDGMYIGLIETLAGSSHTKQKRVMELQWDTEGSVGFTRCASDVFSIAIWFNLEVFETVALDIPMYAIEIAVEAFVHHLAPTLNRWLWRMVKILGISGFNNANVSAASVLVMSTWIKPDRYTESDKRK